MSATKSKPAGRAVRKEPRVRVRKTWISANDFIRSRMPLHENDQQCIIITGYTGSARRLKRLMEIAGNPEPLAIAIFEQTHPRMPWLNNPQCHDQYIRMAADVLQALGLSTTQGRKGARP